MNDERWLLPAGIEEVLPAEAAQLERLRRSLLDLYASWGYELVIPPFIDYLDSLLTGTGHDLDLQTFKLTDQLSGRMLGVRADMTPQVARMDAHQLDREGPTRLCYLGTVLQTRTDGFAGSRSPMQVGAEIYGHDGAASDVEVLRLLLATLEAAGLDSVHVDLGHVGIFRGLAHQAGLGKTQEMALFEALQRKAESEIRDLIDACALPAKIGDMLLALVQLNGADVLGQAETALRSADAPVRAALARLHEVAAEIQRFQSGLPVHFDLAELRGYAYKTGVVFAAFVPGWGLEIGRGGRYDEIGKVFGRARPAVGFSTDLKGLISLADRLTTQAAEAVLAPWSSDPSLVAEMARLRASGRTVIQLLPGQDEAATRARCSQALIEGEEGGWTLSPIMPSV